MNNILIAVSGGAILLKDGEIPETFSSNISGRNPRTAIGSSKDESIIYLITVDGRQESSIGMTQTELAEFLKEIGAYNAMNLDGGGSTTMVGRKLGDTYLSVINHPSGNSLRSVINGVAVFNDAPSSSKVVNLVIEIDDTNIYKGEERNIVVKGYNKYFNPVEIKQDNIKWSYDGVPIDIKDDIIIGDTVGTSILTAKLGSVKSSIEINILNDPNDIKKQDELQKHVELENENSFRIAVVDNMSDSNLMINHFKNKKIEEAINENSEVAVFTSNTNNELLNNINVEKIVCNGYSKKEYKNSMFITIDCINNGIRTTDSSQWIKAQDDIINSNSDNIFIIMNNSLDNFSDNKEAKLWIDILCDIKQTSQKNIWVLHKGIYTDTSTEGEIKYLGINNSDDVEKISNNTNYILITVNGKNLSYEIKNVFK